MFDTILAQIDWSQVQSALIVLGAKLAGVLVVIAGIGFVLGTIFAGVNSAADKAEAAIVSWRFDRYHNHPDEMFTENGDRVEDRYGEDWGSDWDTVDTVDDGSPYQWTEHDTRKEEGYW